MPASISHATIEALVDVITGGGGFDQKPPIGIYRTGPKLESFMRSCGVPMTLHGRSRCPAIRETLLELVEKGDEAILRKVIERSADPRDFQQPEKLDAVIGYLNRCLTLDGLELQRLGPAVRLVRCGMSAPVLESLASASDKLDLDTVRRDLDRALASSHADPEDSVTAACSTLESVCRSVISEMGIPLPATKDIQGLFKAIQGPLGLSPGRGDLPAEVANDIRMVLQGLASMIQGIGALRTHAGDAHGREPGFRRIDARIAHLAIHAASTAALFILETRQQLRSVHELSATTNA